MPPQRCFGPLHSQSRPVCTNGHTRVSGPKAASVTLQQCCPSNVARGLWDTVPGQWFFVGGGHHPCSPAAGARPSCCTSLPQFDAQRDIPSRASRQTTATTSVVAPASPSSRVHGKFCPGRAECAQSSAWKPQRCGGALQGLGCYMEHSQPVGHQVQQSLAYY